MAINTTGDTRTSLLSHALSGLTVNALEDEVVGVELSAVLCSVIGWFVTTSSFIGCCWDDWVVRLESLNCIL